MRPIRIPRTLLVGAVLLSACGPAGGAPAAKTPVPLPAGSWTLTLKQTGGIAGVQLTAQITSAGQLTATNERSGREVTQSLSPETMAEVRGLLGSVDLAKTPQPSSACADCFVYVLEFASSSKTGRIEADDATLGNSGAQDLILLLRSLRDSALTPQP